MSRICKPPKGYQVKNPMINLDQVISIFKREYDGNYEIVFVGVGEPPLRTMTDNYRFRWSFGSSEQDRNATYDKLGSDLLFSD